METPPLGMHTFGHGCPVTGLLSRQPPWVMEQNDDPCQNIRVAARELRNSQ
jgi:hypothetical protein